MITGRYLIEVLHRLPHVCEIKRFGDVYLIDYPDLLGRKRIFEGREIAFGVTIYRERATVSLAKFIIKGNFEAVIYADNDGTRHQAKFIKIETIDDDAEHGKT